MRPSNGIYSGIFLPFMVIFLIATAMAWQFAHSLFERQLIELRERQLGDAVKVLAEANLPLTPEMLRRMGRMLDSRLIALDPGGRPVASDQAWSERNLARALASVNNEARTTESSTFDAADQLFSLIVTPLYDTADERVGALAAVASLSDIRAASRNIALRLAIGALLVIAVLAWVVHRIARGITRPIAQLVTTAHAIASGDLGATADVDRPRELAVLATALGDMARQLDAHRRQAERENRLTALGELAARVAHELRNPLTAIKLQLQIQLERLRDDAERERIARVLEEMRRLELIVSGTLMWAKGSRAEPRPGDLTGVVSEVVELMRPPLRHRGISLHFEAMSLPPAIIDGDRIKQVLFNLINNAADVLSDDGEIAISCTHAEETGSICLTVEDSGPGMPDTGDASRGQVSDKPLGLGMGLAISREILAAHRGSMEITRSVSLGGTRVRLCLPAAASVVDG